MPPKEYSRLIDDEKLKPFYDGVDVFCKETLGDIAEDEYGEGNTKIFSDPIENYITLEDWEVALVNTQLFQRLRYIRQLGLAYLTYPTLGYCRFEHTLGVRARLEQLVQNLRENLAGVKSPQNLSHLLDGNNFKIAKLAALCHDIGHCIFSHVSESVINSLEGTESYPSAKYLIEKFSAYAGKHIPMAEVFAVSIVTSWHFINFINKINLATSFTKAQKIAVSTAHLIMGMPLKGEPTSVFWGQLFNSGIDADKLDYMLRESHSSGIPIGVSLAWLLKKIKLFEVSEGNLPKELRSRIDKLFKSDEKFVVLGLDKGGQFAFEEFCIARLALYEKIYLHQKIRAAESYLRYKLKNLSKCIPEFDEAHRWLYLSESILEYPEKDLPTIPPLQESLLRGNAPRNAINFKLNRLYKRELMFRAYAFGWQNAIAEPFDATRAVTLDDREQEPPKTGTDALMGLIQQKPEKFEEKIRENIHKLMRLLPDECVQGDSENCEIIIDAPRFATIQQGHDSFYIERPNELSLKWTIPIDNIVKYYHDHKALGYIFSEKENLHIVTIAAEMAAWDLFSVIYVQEGFLSPHVVDKAKALKEKLAAKGYYDTIRLLRPVSEKLQNLRSQTLIRELAKQLGLYKTRTKASVTPASITAFLSQFPDDLQEAALDWLQNIKWIEPETELEVAFDELLKANPFRDLSKIALCPLGAASDSASRLAYNLREVPLKYPTKTIVMCSLHEALSVGYDGYILYDDNINTGLQAINIVSGLLGKTLPKEKQLRENHGNPLTEASRTELRNKPLGFAYALAVEGAVENLLNMLVNDIELKRNNIACIASTTLAKEEAVFSGKNSKFQQQKLNNLRDFVQDVAIEILKAEGHAVGDAERRALGYNGAEAMVVFPYNCPTMTVTALWIKGKYGNADWIPLIERARRNNPNM